MTSLLIIIGIIIGILLILIVVIQNPKGGGVAANFSGANQFMGVQKTNDFVEKATWSLSGALLIIALVGSFALSTGDLDGNKRSGLQNKIEAGDLNPGEQNIPTGGGTTEENPTNPD
jgi:preprotein translocase subunit SecG